MPVYNERGTIGEIIRRVTAVNLEKEIIIVDDFSTDGSREYLKELEQQLAKQKTAADSANRLKFLFQDRNYGKGAALRRGFAEACGAIVVIQDADLELNPQEYVKLIAPIERYEADVVYGERRRPRSQLLGQPNADGGFEPFYGPGADRRVDLLQDISSRSFK